MQQDPLLEQLDWFFSSVNWATDYPNTMVLPMAKITSDHIPCKISIGTKIPKSNLFRFENFWPEHPGFFEIVLKGLEKLVSNQKDSTTMLARKLKNVRYELKHWSKNLSNLSLLISKTYKLIFFMDSLEEVRPLLSFEWNFRALVKSHLATLLDYKNKYWRKRFIVNRIKFGDECIKFFHAIATISYRKNSISQLRNENGQDVSDHEGKASLLWSAFKK